MFGIEFLRDDEHLETHQSPADNHALALAMAVLHAKDVGANHIRLSDCEGVLIDDFAIGAGQALAI